jgi:uncharacterized protein YaiL (DUF2058 family)
LLQAGLGNKKQSKEAERQVRQQERERQQRPKDQRGTASRGQLEAQRAQLAKAARDQKLSRQSLEQADKKARRAQIAQLIEQNRLPRAQTEERYNFVDGSKVRVIAADQSVRERLGRGEIAIVRGNAGYELVPADVAARFRVRDETAVVKCGADPGSAADDGVPEDLMW